MTTARIEVEGAGVAVPQDGEDTILRSALRAGLGFPYECNAGGCGSCKFDLVSGEIENLWPEAPGLTDRDRRKNKRLACQSRAKGEVCIKVRLSEEYRPAVIPRRFPAKFAEAIPVTHDITEFRFVADGPAEFLPGQYAMLSLPGVAASRAYSMCNIANGRGEWHFQIRRVKAGQGTAVLFERTKPGDVIGIDGPYGLAYLRTHSPRDIVCVAGGSGLAPMVSIARGASSSAMLATRRLHFFYGGRTPRDICGEECLRGLSGYGERIRYYPVVSANEEGVADRWAGETGFVHELVKRKLDRPLRDFEFYFAGPPPMTQAIQEMLMLTHQVPFNQIHFDRFF